MFSIVLYLVIVLLSEEVFGEEGSCVNKSSLQQSTSQQPIITRSVNKEQIKLLKSHVSVVIASSRCTHFAPFLGAGRPPAARRAAAAAAAAVVAGPVPAPRDGGRLEAC